MTARTDAAPRSAGTYAGAAAVGMFVLLLIGYTVNAMDRQVFPVLLVAVGKDFGFTPTQAGLQSTVFSLGIGIMGIPVGYLVNRFSRKLSVVVGTLIFSAATALTTLSLGFWDMTLWRVLSGVGEALQVTALIAIAAVAFPARRGMAIGTVNICFAAGALIGPAAGGAILDATGQWRVPELIFAVLGGIVAVLIALLVRPWLTERREGAVPTQTIVGGEARVLNRTTLTLVVITVLGGLADFGFLGQYATFLQTQLHYSAAESGLVTGLSGAGAFLSFAGGALGDRFSPRIVLGLSYGLTGVAGLAIFLGPTGIVWQAIWALVFGIAFSSGAFVLLAGFLVKSVDVRHTGIASGIFVTSMYIPAAFAGLLMSALAQALGWGWAAVLQIVLACVIAVALSLTLQPARFSRVTRTPAVAEAP